MSGCPTYGTAPSIQMTRFPPSPTLLAVLISLPSAQRRGCGLDNFPLGPRVQKTYGFSPDKPWLDPRAALQLVRLALPAAPGAP